MRLRQLTSIAGILAIGTSQNETPLATDLSLWLAENQALLDDTSWVPEGLHSSFYQEPEHALKMLEALKLSGKALEQEAVFLATTER